MDSVRTPAAQAPLRHQHNGWTPERQQRFLDHLAMHGSVSGAARAAGMTKQSAYWFRRQPAGAAFAQSWGAALEDSGRIIEDAAMDRLIDGEEEVIERYGVMIVRRRPCNIQLLLYHLKRLDDQRNARAAVQLAMLRRRWDQQDASAPPPVDPEKVEKLRAELRAMAELQGEFQDEPEPANARPSRPGPRLTSADE